MTGEGGEADRDTVLGWMTRTQNGPKAAAERFGLPVERVKKWAQRAGVVTPPPPPKPPPMPRIRVAPVPAPAPVTPIEPDASPGVPLSDDSGDKGVSRGVSLETERPPKERPSRAKGSPPGAVPAPRFSAANMSADDRERLRRAVRQQLDFLSDEATVDDQKGRSDAARALQTLLLTTPDILTFDERTAGTTEKQDDRTEKLAKALGLDLPGGGAE